eukprot:TRINITY_DN30704_c0_g1_i1.p1 TRINITY_DN30704_c0_g1~~TRINITY_DN30704_c0_g1_i1.p1  ORF type:complete len:232 (-),score=31.28 TRINITY_DN30704_c0_g1_i1:151-846(-)
MMTRCDDWDESASLRGTSQEAMPAQQVMDRQRQLLGGTGGILANSNERKVRVVIANSRMMAEDETLVDRIVTMANDAYGRGRMHPSEVKQRISMGDAGRWSNRVLHLAFRDGELVGCCSSTIQPPFTCFGWGHWGLMTVDRKVQGTGVGSALVAAAEDRLRCAGCFGIQIEYHYSAGEPRSEHLRDWYEGKLGFTCLCGGDFRLCHKLLCPPKCCPPACPPSCCFCCLCCI